MDWLRSRRLSYLFGVSTVFFLTWALLRLLFLGGFSGLTLSVVDRQALLQVLGIGLRFDLRLALLLILPLGVLCYLPRWNLVRNRAVRLIARGYLGLALVITGLIYVIDFGHFNYLGVRINATVFRFT